MFKSILFFLVCLVLLYVFLCWVGSLMIQHEERMISRGDDDGSETVDNPVNFVDLYKLNRGSSR